MSDRAHHYFDGLVDPERVEEVCREVAEELEFNDDIMMTRYEASEREACDEVQDE